MKANSKTTLARRHFLQQMLLLGGATGAASLVLETGRNLASPGHPVQAGKDNTAPTNTRGYRLTDHIRTYYEKARI